MAAFQYLLYLLNLLYLILIILGPMKSLFIGPGHCFLQLVLLPANLPLT